MSFKQKIYDGLVRKNKNVQKEYERYVIEHIGEHNKKRLKHWKILWSLTWHYRVRKIEDPLIYSEDKICSDENTVNKDMQAAGEDDKKSSRNSSEKFEIIIKQNGGIYLDISWKKIEKAYCYNVYYSEDKKNYKFSCKVYESSCRIEKLSPDHRYFIKIKYSFNGINYKDDLKISEIKTRGLNQYERFFGTRSIYSDGAESSYKPIMEAMNMAKGLMKYETISFDVFDTLLFRPFSKPSDVFILIGTKLDIMDFCQIRIDAEQEARQRAKLLRGNTEVTIYDIYEIVEIKTGIPKEVGVSVEFETELDLCFANPYMKRVFDLVRYQDKNIIICSDMYYPAEMLGKLLKRCGFDGYTDLYVSCEHNCTKRDGGLYEIIKAKYPVIVHIGDNHLSDIEMASKAGVDNIRYQNVNEKGNKFRAEHMSHLVGSAYRGIINAHLHNGTKRYTPYYEMGFVYAGIYVFGFCQWIHKKAKKNNVEKILFLAREGDIYQKVFDQSFSDMETEYTLWSRVPVVKTIVKKNRHPYLLQLVHHKANAIYKSKITTLFKRIGIERLLKYLNEYRINEDEYLTPQNEKVVEKLMVDHWEEICDCYENDLQKTKDYLQALIRDSRNIAVVDVGWSGNNVLQIKYLVEEVFKMDCKVTCLLAATREVNDTYMAGMMQDEQVETYIFSNMYNRFLHDFHQDTNKKLNSFFFEIMTQSATPTFLGFKENGFLFDIPEIENYEHDREIHQGILDFAKIYKSVFQKYPYMYNVCGNDAYMPFRMLVSDLTYLKKYFSGFVFGRDLFATQEKAVMETVGEVMEKAGV